MQYILNHSGLTYRQPKFQTYIVSLLTLLIAMFGNCIAALPLKDEFDFLHMKPLSYTMFYSIIMTTCAVLKAEACC